MAYAFLLGFLTSRNQSIQFLLLLHKNEGYKFFQKSSLHCHVLSDHPCLGLIQEWNHLVVRLPTSLRHWLGHHYVVVHWHILIQKLLLNGLLLTVLFYLLFHIHHNTFFQGTLRHIYWSSHHPLLASLVSL